jgi:DNA-binding NtrC family response regulator
VKLRLLVFDDDERILRLLQNILSRHGCEVFTFSDATDFCLRHPPACLCDGDLRCADAVLSDISMPTISGLDLFSRMKARQCRIPNWAFISGHWSAENLRIAREAGCKVFNKPLDLSAMTDWLRACERRANPTRLLADDIHRLTGRQP